MWCTARGTGWYRHYSLRAHNELVKSSLSTRGSVLLRLSYDATCWTGRGAARGPEVPTTGTPRNSAFKHFFFIYLFFIFYFFKYLNWFFDRHHVIVIKLISNQLNMIRWFLLNARPIWADDKDETKRKWIGVLIGLTLPLKPTKMKQMKRRKKLLFRIAASGRMLPSQNKWTLTSSAIEWTQRKRASCWHADCCVASSIVARWRRRRRRRRLKNPVVFICHSFCSLALFLILIFISNCSFGRSLLSIFRTRRPGIDADGNALRLSFRWSPSNVVEFLFSFSSFSSVDWIGIYSIDLFSALDWTVRSTAPSNSGPLPADPQLLERYSIVGFVGGNQSDAKIYLNWTELNFEWMNWFSIFNDWNGWNWVWNWRRWPTNQMPELISNSFLNFIQRWVKLNSIAVDWLMDLLSII